MKVLVTGGCGFLGSNLASSYLQEGAEVVVIDALFRQGSAANLSWLLSQSSAEKFHFVQADLANSDSVHAVFRRHAPFDYVIHAGGQVAMTTSLENPSRDLQTNVIGTFNILEAVRSFSPKALIAYSSTNKVYGDLNDLSYEETSSRYCLKDFPEGLDETLRLDFSTPYGCSKGAADQYVHDWARVYGLKTVVFRHSSIYGGRQFASFDQGWIGWFCRNALEQQRAYNDSKHPTPFTIAGNGKQVRDVLHVNDLIRLYKTAFDKNHLMNGEIFNIGGGARNSLSLLELFTLLSDLLNTPPLVFTQTPRRASDQDCFIADIRKAEHVLGWKPSLDCRNGIQQMLEWIHESMTQEYQSILP